MSTISGIKLVALDLDGTLLGKDLKIPPRSRAAIAAARSRGVQFVIATGRMYQSSVPMARTLELDGAPLIAYNGALVCEFPSGRPLFHEPVPLEACRSLAAFCEARGYHLQAYIHDRLYVPNLGPRTREYLDIARVEASAVGSLFFWLQEPSTKLLVVDDPERISLIQEQVTSLLAGAVTAMPSSPNFLEVVSSKVSKGAALERVAQSLGLAPDDVMAVGDGSNDLSMLKWAGTGVAIGHAPAALRQVAAYVTKSGPGEGVAEALEHFGLTGQA